MVTATGERVEHLRRWILLRNAMGDNVGVDLAREGAGSIGEKQMSLAEALLQPQAGGEHEAGGDRRGGGLGAARALPPRCAPAATGRPPYDRCRCSRSSSAAALRAVRPAARGGALRPPVVPPLLRLSAGEGAPDETTLCRFRRGGRERRPEAGLAEVDRQLATKGLILKNGTLLEATMVAAKRRKPERAAGLGAKFIPSRTRAGPRRAAAPISATPPCRRRRGLGPVRSLVLTPAR